MQILRGATASQELPLGRFVDSTDGDTEETGLTIANTDIKVWKNGATTYVSKNSGGATHIANGEYYCVLDATDTNTPGTIKITVHVAGALSVTVWGVVLPTNVYDSIIAVTDFLQVDAVQFAGQTITAGAGVTMPSSVASPTNITAGTITNVTNASITAAAVTSIWHQLLSNITTANTIGKLLKDNIDATVSSDSAGVTTLLGRLTSVRAGLLDFLDALISSRSTYAGGDTSGTTTLLSRLTSGRATAIDNLDATVSSRTKPADTQAAVTLVATTTDVTNPVSVGTVATVGTVTNPVTVSGSVSITGDLSETMKTSVQTAVAAELDASGSELASVPAVTSSLRLKLQYLFQYFRNKRTITASTETLYKDNDSTSLGTSAISDDSTTVTIGKKS